MHTVHALGVHPSLHESVVVCICARRPRELAIGNEDTMAEGLDEIANSAKEDLLSSPQGKTTVKEEHDKASPVP